MWHWPATTGAEKTEGEDARTAANTSHLKDAHGFSSMLVLRGKMTGAYVDYITPAITGPSETLSETASEILKCAKTRNVPEAFGAGNKSSTVMIRTASVKEEATGGSRPSVSDEHVSE